MTKMNNILMLQVDKEFERVIPPLDEDEFKNLRLNILRDGEIYHPIITWNGVIVDGHYRYKILKENPTLKYRVEEKTFENRYEAISWICLNQLGRRNLSAAQKTILMGRRYQAEKDAHGASEGFRGNRYTGGLVNPQNADLLNNEASVSRKIAREMGVNHSTVERAGEFVDGLDAAEEVSAGITKDIQAGKVKVTHDEMLTIGKAPPEKRKELVDCLYVPTSNMSQEEREQERQRRKELFRSIDNLYAGHLNTERPPATGADMLKAFETDVEIAIDTIGGYFTEYPDLLTDKKNREFVDRVLNKIQEFLNKIEEK